MTLDLDADSLPRKSGGDAGAERAPEVHDRWRPLSIRAAAGSIKSDPGEDRAAATSRAARQGPPATRAVKGYAGAPATLGSTAAAAARLIVWCNACRHQAEPDVAVMAAKYGAATPVRDWVGRLVCSHCGGRNISFVLTGARR
jgi:hypothetical protein